MVKKRRLDIIILIVLIVIAIGSWIAVTVLFDVNGDYVEVIVDNHVQKVISLNDDGEYQVDDGEYSNIITIKNREVYMKSSDCPDQICVKQGKIKKQGESIICLPHKLVIRIASEEYPEVYSNVD